MVIINAISLILLAIGGLNWGLVGIFKWNLVDAIFGVGSVLSSIIYVLVAISAIWLLFNAFASKRLTFCTSECNCGCDKHENY